MRIKLGLISLLLFFFSILQISNLYAADLGMQNLPEGAKYRIGRGVFKQIRVLGDGSQIAVVSNIGIWIYNVHSGEALHLLPNISGMDHHTFSPDGKTLAMGGYTSVTLMDTETGATRTLSGHGYYVVSFSFSPDGKTLATGSWDRTVRLWEVETGKHILKLGGDIGSVLQVCLSPDGRTIASVDGDDKKTIRLWDTVSEKQLRILTENVSNIKKIVFSIDGKSLISVGDDNSIRSWDIETGKQKPILDTSAVKLTCVAIRSDNQMFATGGDDKTIQLWDFATGEYIFTFRYNTGQVKHLDFSPDGKTIACVNDDNTIRLWNVETGRRLLLIKEDVHSDRISDITFSPDGNIIATSSHDRTIMLWDAETGNHKRTLEGHTANVNGMRFSHDGKIIASCGDKNIFLWDAKRGRYHRTIMSQATRSKHEAGVFSIALSPDGQTIVTGGQDKTIRLWYKETGLHYKTIKTNTDHHTWGVGFSPDGKTIVSANVGYKETIIQLWESETGILKHTWFGSLSDINSSSFSPDGQTIVIANHNTLELRDVETGTVKESLLSDEVTNGVSFSPNGKIIASCTHDGNIHVWNTKTGHLIKTFKGHQGKVTNLAFSPDGNTIGSVGEDMTVLVWDISSYVTNVDAKVSLSPSTININRLGQKIIFSLDITSGENVSGYQATIFFDPSILRYVGSKLGDYLPTDSFFVSPIVEKNSITLAASSSGTESKGDGSLATLTFEVIANNISTLNLSDVILTDSIGVSSQPRSENAKIEKIATTIFQKEDVNRDGVINFQDRVLVGKNLGKIGKNPADVNADGVVNIVDITLVEKAINKTKTKAPTKE